MCPAGEKAPGPALVGDFDVISRATGTPNWVAPTHQVWLLLVFFPPVVRSTAPTTAPVSRRSSDLAATVTKAPTVTKGLGCRTCDAFHLLILACPRSTSPHMVHSAVHFWNSKHQTGTGMLRCRLFDSHPNIATNLGTGNAEMVTVCHSEMRGDLSRCTKFLWIDRSSRLLLLRKIIFRW